MLRTPRGRRECADDEGVDRRSSRVPDCGRRDPRVLTAVVGNSLQALLALRYVHGLRSKRPSEAPNDLVLVALPTQ